MSDKTFYLFSYLSAQRKNNIGIWDSLCYLVSKMIVDVGIQQINNEELCKSFYDYYSYPIPFYPMKELIRRMVSKDLLVCNGTTTKPNFSKIKNLINDDSSIEYNFDNLIGEIIVYIKEIFNISYEKNQIKDGLLSYLNEYQSEFLSSYKDLSPLEINEDKDLLYMINHFIFNKIKIDSSFKNDLLTLILANLNLSSIFYNRANSLKEDFQCTIFLDTRIIFRLLGCEGEYKKKEYESFIEDLINRKCKLRIFKQHYDEVMENLSDCEKWIISDDFNYNSASPILQFFYDNHKDIEDIKLYEKKVGTLLKKYNIKIVEAEEKEEIESPDGIDAEELAEKKFSKHRMKELIIEEYKKNNDYFDEYSKDQIIENDVKALLYIHEKRFNKKPEKISQIKYLLLTTNSALVKANRQIINEDDDFYRFTECLTDCFLGSYLWLTTANTNPFILQNRIISASYEYIKLNPKVKRAFLEKIERCKESIEESEYIALREDELAYGLLAEKTLNKEENVSDLTPGEIITAYRRQVIKETIPQLNKYEEDESKLEHSIKVIDRISRILTIIILSGFSLLLNILPNDLIEQIPFVIVKKIIWVILKIIGAYITYTGFGIKFIANDRVYKLIDSNFKKLLFGKNI